MSDMEEILAELQRMIEVNPEAYQKIMESMSKSLYLSGTNTNDNLPHVSGISSNDGVESDNISQGNMSINQMAEAIMHMRNASVDVEGKEPDLIMSKDKPKQPKGIHITPIAGFTFKTIRVKDKKKVFINMTQHEAIAEPGLKKKLDHEGNEIEGMNIPMSVGPAMEDIDKKGVPCIIYDIIVNPIVITESTADKTGKYRDFICQLGMQYLEQKYSNELDRRYKLPKLQYMGEKIASQFIQDRKNIPKIEEVSTSNNSSSGSTRNSSNGRNGNKGLNDKTNAKNVVEAVDKPLSFKSYWLTSLQSSSSLLSMSSSTSSSDISDIEGTSNYHLFHRSFGEIIDVNKYSIEPYTYSLFDYIDPIYTPPPPTITTNSTITIQTKAIMITVDIHSVDIDLNTDISISISPYRLHLKIIGYKKYTIYLCCAINPIASYYNICRPFDGCLSQLQLQIVLLVDTRPFETVTDAGSKTWLLAQALSNSNSVGDRDHDGGMSSDNPYESDYGMDSQGKRVINDRSSANVNNRSDGTVDEMPEDKFHLRLPSNVDQYTGVTIDDDVSNNGKTNGNSSKSAVNKPSQQQQQQQHDNNIIGEDEQELPEDRFHQKDATSSYLISQREQAKKDKWDKHEKEKKERMNDPNIEYVDMDDFRPGGKHGPKEEIIAATNIGLVSSKSSINPEIAQELLKASEVVASAIQVVFNGRKMGYMFKNGSKGIGYYLDSQQQQQQQIPAKDNDKVNEYSSKKKDKDSVSLKKEASPIDPSYKRSRKDDISEDEKDHHDHRSHSKKSKKSNDDKKHKKEKHKKHKSDKKKKKKSGKHKTKDSKHRKKDNERDDGDGGDNDDDCNNDKRIDNKREKDKRKRDTDDDDSKQRKTKRNHIESSSSSSSSSRSSSDSDDSSNDVHHGEQTRRSIITGKKIKMHREITMEDKLLDIERAAKRHYMNSQYQ